MSEGSNDTSSPWTARVVTLFPEAFPGMLGLSLVGKGLAKELWKLETIDLRHFGIGIHNMVDDSPAGGGAGMILRPDVLAAALRSCKNLCEGAQPDWPIICLTPRGRMFNQKIAERLSHGRGVTLICGRFEGIDQRVIDSFGMDEISIGDFVLSGGEIAAQALIESTVRLIPNILGNWESIQNESFDCGLLEHPHYTRPQYWEGQLIPEVLISGHHGKIAEWRQAQAQATTKTRRPDLWQIYCAGLANRN